MNEFKYDDPHKQGFKEGFQSAEAEYKPEIERLRAMQQGYREESSKLRIENARLQAALSEFATSENWNMGARFDPNSPRFDGQAFAQHVLEL